MDRVTVVIVTHDGADEIQECLECLVGNGAGSPHVVVVDNASSDGTPELVKSGSPAVELIVLPENYGYGFGANIGSERSSREFIAFLNQDARASPSWLEASIAALEENPSAAFVTPKILIRQNPARINTCGNTIHVTGITTCRGYDQSAVSFAQREFVIGMSGAALVGRKSAFRRLGGFDESFFMYYEDTDLSLRGALAGFKCLYEPEAVVTHSFEPSFSAQKLYVLERNRYASLFKVLRVPTLLLLGPVLVLAELAVWGYCVSRGPGLVASKFKAWIWLAGHVREISNARHAVQELRKAGDRELLAGMTGSLDLSELGSPLATICVRPLNLLFRMWRALVRVVVFW
ncbi:MAG: glycosyltransferase family 2 protein [Chloroflexi bacterium]|nr:glycosyltransferase family 2 protein [Chloroflexota bacterium]MCY3938729.1 glycosyltransferase family 2 protein [Chloroflexota bacterium]